MYIQIPDAIKALRNGNVVAIPTETVYGLAADATNSDAVKKNFALKNRPLDNPLIVHLARKEDIVQYAYIQNDIETLLIDKLMPGPFTLLLQKKNTIPDIITAWTELVSIRIPDHPLTQELLSQLAFPLAAPSANPSGKASPTTASMVHDYFGDALPILDGGPCHIGIESTVAQVVTTNNETTVLIHRPWFITPDDIQSVVWPAITVVYSNTKQNISPWIKYKHYAPKAQVHLLAEWMFPDTNNPTTAIIATKEWFDEHLCDLENIGIHRYVRWSRDDLLSCAQNLFQLYHQCDRDGMKHIYIEALPELWVGYAIMNRVKKSIEY